MSWIRRLGNVPARNRVAQIVNGIATPILCGPLRITHVMEHPKCGGTWVANTIRTYIGSKEPLGDRLLRRDDVIHGHRLFRRSYRNPVIVVRDPRDVFVSFYYHEVNNVGRERYQAIWNYFTHDPNRPVHEDFALYLRAKLTHRTHPPFSYTEFVQSWIDRPGVCVVRYEDFLEDTKGELERILRSLGRPIDANSIERAVEENTFANRTKARTGKSRRPGEEDPTVFERKGIAGDWKNHFDPDSCELIEEHESYVLRRLGYEKDRSWIESYVAATSESPADSGGSPA